MHWRRISSINRRIDEIDDCHSCFLGGPGSKKCNVSYQSTLALFISYLTAAKSFKCKDFGVGQFSSVSTIFPTKKVAVFQSLQPTRAEKNKHTLPERVYQLNQKFLTKPRWTLGWEVMMEVPGSYSSYSSWPGVVSAVVEVNPPSMWLGSRWVVRGES